VAGPVRRPSVVPSSDSELINRIKDAVADALDCSAEQVGLDDNLYETLGLDSLGTVAVFTDLSYFFGTPEPDSDFDFESIHSVRLLAEYVRSSGGRRPVTNRDEVTAPDDTST
jgi:acyl carrier protein